MAKTGRAASGGGQDSRGKTKKKKISRSAGNGQDCSGQAKKQNISLKPWPSEDPSKLNQPWPQGLLHGMDDAIWAALARVPLDIYQNKKGQQQGTIREALNLVGMGWVATNTTSYRMAMGKPHGKYISARAIHEANGWQPPAAPLPTISEVKFDDKFLPKEADFEDLHQNKDKVLSAIEEHGVVVIRKLYSNEIGEEFDEGKTQRKLAKTKGDGIAGGAGVGVSYYADLKSETWDDLQNTMLSEFLTGEVLDHALRNRKAIVLRYAEGAENFAHRDGLSATDDANCSIKAFPYQGTVMVSKPDVDFTGGEFYVASKDAESGKITRTKVEFKNPGDVVLFRADNEGGYEHGMLTVGNGSAATCERVAIGLFQKKIVTGTL